MCLKPYNKKVKISENTQGIIQYFRKNIFSLVEKKMGQNMNEYLNEILKQEEDYLNSIIIFELGGEGLPIYYSSIDLDPRLDNALFGDNDIGLALADFGNIKQVQKALDSFGKFTKSGELNYSIFTLTQARMMVYFYNLPDLPVAICFIAFGKNVTLGKLVISGKKHIEEIKKKLNK